ncbi:unnamed protein product [Urochloa humidicola]
MFMTHHFYLPEDYALKSDKHEKDKGRLVSKGSIDNPYPFCWCLGTLLFIGPFQAGLSRLRRLRTSCWNVTRKHTPDYVNEKIFHNWLEGARDWAISRRSSKIPSGH